MWMDILGRWFHPYIYGLDRKDQNTNPQIILLSGCLLNDLKTNFNPYSSLTTTVIVPYEPGLN